MPNREMKTQVLIVGGGTGGVAAALAALAGGAHVILAESTDWIGGQFTSQVVPPDENPWVETTGATRRYQELRQGIRQWYRDYRPLTPAARADQKLNPGGGHVSALCHEPRVSLAVMNDMLAPYLQKNQLTILLRHTPIGAGVDADQVRAVTLFNQTTGDKITIIADYFLDATELGDLLPLTNTEYVTGAESQQQTGEPHALSGPADPANIQSFTWCLPMAWDPTPHADHTIDKPHQWDYWRTFIPNLTPPWSGPLLNWTYCQPRSLKPIKSTLFSAGAKHGEQLFWTYRRIIRSDIYHGQPPEEVTVMNWPQNDFTAGNVIDQPPETVAARLEASRQLSLSMMYWLQTQAPRPDGGIGYPGLRLRPDLTGTADGLAMAPYFRESRRIKALFTITENHVGAAARYHHENINVTKLPPAIHAEPFPDSVGIGYYRIDLHPTSNGRNYIDIASLPFQIPLGALLPQRVTNLLPACKNIGTTHITNGCYRLHPVEWNIGESAGALAAFCLTKNLPPKSVHDQKESLEEFQKLLRNNGIQLNWIL